MGFTRRRGRPKSQKPVIDYGTKELRLKKWVALGENVSDSVSSDSLLGILWARRQIDDNMYQAGCFFQALYYKYSGTFHENTWHASSRPIKISHHSSPSSGGETLLENEKQLELLDEWVQTHQFLQGLGPRPYASVVHVTCLASPYDLPPSDQLNAAKHALFCLYNWLNSKKHVKV